MQKNRNMWTGHSMFRTLVNMGLVEDHRPPNKTNLTLRGLMFLKQETGEIK